MLGNNAREYFITMYSMHTTTVEYTSLLCLYGIFQCVFRVGHITLWFTADAQTRIAISYWAHLRVWLDNDFLLKTVPFI